MKHLIFKLGIAVFFLNYSSSIFGSQNFIDDPILDPKKLCDTYSGYQDVIIHNQIFRKGPQNCMDRYELIRPILDRYERKFSVLDIGAMEGYFSFRIAEDYDAICTMIEGGNDPSKKTLYWFAQEKLFSLCMLNNHLENVSLLAHKLTLPSLRKLNDLEHFDVIISFLVLHYLAKVESGHISVEKLEKCIDVLLSLGSDVIIEMSVDSYAILDRAVHQICIEKGGEYLGELPRAKAEGHKSKGRFYWFSNQQNYNGKDAQRISDETFQEFNGIYPKK